MTSNTQLVAITLFTSLLAGPFAPGAASAATPPSGDAQYSAMQSMKHYLGKPVAEAARTASHQLGEHYAVHHDAYGGHAYVKLKPYQVGHFGSLSSIVPGRTAINMYDDGSGHVRSVWFENGPAPFDLERGMPIGIVRDLIKRGELGKFVGETNKTAEGRTMSFAQPDGTHLKLVFSSAGDTERFQIAGIAEPPAR